MLSHKEFRFLFPLLPMAMQVCGVYLHNVCDDEEDYEEEQEEETTSRPNPPEPSSQTQVCCHVSSMSRKYIGKTENASLVKIGKYFVKKE